MRIFIWREVLLGTVTDNFPWSVKFCWRQLWLFLPEEKFCWRQLWIFLPEVWSSVGESYVYFYLKCEVLLERLMDIFTWREVLLETITDIFIWREVLLEPVMDNFAWSVKFCWRQLWIFLPEVWSYVVGQLWIFVCIVTWNVKVCLKHLQTNLPAVLVTSCRTTDTLSSWIPSSPHHLCISPDCSGSCKGSSDRKPTWGNWK